MSKVEFKARGFIKRRNIYVLILGVLFLCIMSVLYLTHNHGPQNKALSAGTITRTTSGKSTNLMIMDGTTAIKDLMTGTSFTMTGGVGGVFPGDSSNFQLPSATGLLGAQAPVIAQTNNNLLSNEDASFEGGTVGNWVNQSNATLANDATWYYHGTKCLKATAIATAVCDINLLCASFTSGGVQYTFSAKVKGVAGKTLQIYIYDNVTGWQASPAITTTGATQTISYTFTYGAGSTTRDVLFISNSYTAGTSYYVDACQLEAGAVQTPFALDYRTASTCKIATPFSAGSPISIMLVVNTPWAGNDGATHYLFSNNTNSQVNANAITIYKDVGNNLALTVCDNAARLKYKYGGVNGTNWAANVNHVVIATIAADDTLSLKLDGTAMTTNAGTGTVRESSLVANTYIGTLGSGASPINGAILCAIWGRVLTSSEITALSSLSNWSGAGGGLGITVSGLSTGNAARIYDGSNNIIASAVSSSGVATLEATSGVFTSAGMTGYIKVFTDSGYGTEIGRYPAVGNATDIWGGDAYQYNAPPGQPTNLHHTANTISSISWDWDDTPTATGYKVYRASDNVELADVASSNWDQGSLSAKNTQYSVYVTAYNGNGEGLASSTASAYTSIENPTGATWGTVGTDSIELSGAGTISNLSSGLSGIYFRESVTGTNSGWLTTNTWTRDLLMPNTQYHFYITTRNGDGEANPEQGPYDKYTLAAPVSGASASAFWDSNPALNNYIIVSWNILSATTVRIRCLNTGTDIYTGAWSPYVHSLLPANTLYTYRIYSRNGEGVENPSYVQVQAVTPPDQPQNLVLQEVTKTGATVTWDLVLGATGYILSYGTDTNAENLGTITLTGISNTTYTFQNLTPGTRYYVKVRAIGSTGSLGAWSNIITFQTEGIPPSPSGPGLLSTGMKIFLILLLSAIIFTTALFTLNKFKLRIKQ